MDKIKIIDVDHSNMDKITFVPIRIENNISKRKFLLYRNVSLIFFVISVVILNYVLIISYFNFLIGLYGLLSASLLTLLLLIIWESYKARNKEKLYLQAFMNELEHNMIVIFSNLDKLKIENKNFNVNKLNLFDIEPYYQIRFDFWTSLMQNIPLDFLKIDIRNFEAFIFESHRFNEMLEARNDSLKNPLINVKPIDDSPLDIFTNVFLIKKQYNEMLIKQCEKVSQYLEETLKSRGKLTKLDFDAHNRYKSFDDAIKMNKIILPNSIEKKKYEKLYNEKNQVLIFYQYEI